MKLHEMICDSAKQEVRVGKTIEVDSSKINSVKPVSIWQLNKYLSKMERKKVDSNRIGNEGSLIKMKNGDIILVIESPQFIIN